MLLFVIERLDDEDDFAFMKNLYEEYTPWMKKYITRCIRDPYAIEDLIQDCIVNLTRHVDLLRSFATPQQVHGYIAKTTKNTALNYLIKSSRENIIPVDIADYLIDEPAENETEAYVELKLTYEDAKKNLQNLSERDRELIKMKYALELSDKDNNTETNYFNAAGEPTVDAYLDCNVFCHDETYFDSAKGFYYRQYAIGNMGNDKKNVEIFHSENSCCVENCNNNSAYQKMLTPIDFSVEGGKDSVLWIPDAKGDTEYEFRYPEEPTTA